jgi:hypothetical protein
MGEDHLLGRVSMPQSPYEGDVLQQEVELMHQNYQRLQGQKNQRFLMQTVRPCLVPFNLLHRQANSQFPQV